MDGAGVLDALFFTNAAPILLIDPGRDGAIVDANPRAAAFYGHSRERLRSLHVWDINQLGRAILPAMREIASWEGGHYPQRFHHRLADGSVRDVQVYAGPIHLGGRKLLLCIIHDITAVIEAEQFNRLLLENVQVGVCGIDRAGAVTFVNPTAVCAFGFRHESELIRSHYDFAAGTAGLTGRGKRLVYGVLASAEARNLRLLHPLWSRSTGAPPAWSAQGRLLGGLRA
ncbi:PAS domain-containing protein [Azospirillum endophyticum]